MTVLYAYEVDQRASEDDVKAVFDPFGNIDHVILNKNNWPRIVQDIRNELGYGAFICAESGTALRAKGVLHNTE